EITEVTDLSMYVMTAEFGAPTQLEKIDMIDYADFIVINKFEQKGSMDAFNQVRKQYERSRMLFQQDKKEFPVFGTIASQFNDPGMNALFATVIDTLNEKFGWNEQVSFERHVVSTERKTIIPNDRSHYLREISDIVRNYHKRVEQQSEIARDLYAIDRTKKLLQDHPESTKELNQTFDQSLEKLQEPERQILNNWDELKNQYHQETMTFSIRDREMELDITTTTLSGTTIPKVIFPHYTDWGDRLKWSMKENVPGQFPYTAGVFPFKRKGEDPTRQFAGEGTPERTNRRFHYLSEDSPAKRLSTAFDSVTLYGEDPAYELDVYGKVGESGVNVCTLDDMKKLYAGFDLIDPQTSVSMTINGPAPIILAMYFNTAIDQQVEKFKETENRKPTKEEYEKI